MSLHVLVSALGANLMQDNILVVVKAVTDTLRTYDRPITQS